MNYKSLINGRMISQSEYDRLSLKDKSNYRVASGNDEPYSNCIGMPSNNDIGLGIAIGMGIGSLLSDDDSSDFSSDSSSPSVDDSPSIDYGGGDFGGGGAGSEW